MDLFSEFSSMEACYKSLQREIPSKCTQPPACSTNPIWSIRKLSLFMICYIIKSVEAGEVRIWRAEYDVRLMMFQLKIDNLHDVMFTLLRFATNKGQVGVGRMMEMLWRERTFCALSAQMEDFVLIGVNAAEMLYWMCYDLVLCIFACGWNEVKGGGLILSKYCNFTS